MKKILKSFGAVFLLLAIASYAYDVIDNQFILRNQKQFINALKHPEGTNLLARKNAVGLLSGNSNHCDFFAGELRDYNLPKSDIEDYYDTHKHKVKILFIDNGIIPEARIPDHLKNIKAWGLSTEQVIKPVYLLYRFKTMQANKDIRCH